MRAALFTVVDHSAWQGNPGSQRRAVAVWVNVGIAVAIGLPLVVLIAVLVWPE
ncbi:hypothetical protein AB0M45_25835 [Nocardia sp. NPDC051787]|uniref:hypothetical protein n=1 Tax=Nocardia sp. NPDC051787 TaxID=3155415 RepID=UPI003413403C